MRFATLPIKSWFSLHYELCSVPNRKGVIYATRTIGAVRIVKYKEDNCVSKNITPQCYYVENTSLWSRRMNIFQVLQKLVLEIFSIETIHYIVKRNLGDLREREKERERKREIRMEEEGEGDIV